MSGNEISNYSTQEQPACAWRLRDPLLRRAWLLSSASASVARECGTHSERRLHEKRQQMPSQHICVFLENTHLKKNKKPSCNRTKSQRALEEPHNPSHVLNTILKANIRNESKRNNRRLKKNKHSTTYNKQHLNNAFN